jgi:hypothetical protein
VVDHHDPGSLTRDIFLTDDTIHLDEKSKGDLMEKEAT